MIVWLQVNMRGLLPDDYRIRHPTAPKMVPWHTGNDLELVVFLGCILSYEMLTEQASAGIH